MSGSGVTTIRVRYEETDQGGIAHQRSLERALGSIL